MTIALGAYAILTLVIHKIPWLSPTTTVEAAQLAVSKGLIFVAIGYLVLFFSRNYLASRHNAVVNRHRQNSLVTYRALVEAAGDQTNREVVLTRAAESIFGAQATGFAKTDPGDNRGLSLVSVAHQMARPTIGDGS
jgi:hypothetical protein